MSKLTYYTKEGLQKLKDEIDHLLKVERPGISKQIAEARDKGDLSENAEYDAAKDAQGLLEMKIIKLQNIFAGARVIDQKKMNSSKVYLFSKVTIRNLKNNRNMTYSIVPENESDIRNSKLSVESPVAKGLLGLCVGDVVEIEVPAGKLEFEIVKIESDIS